MKKNCTFKHFKLTVALFFLLICGLMGCSSTSDTSANDISTTDTPADNTSADVSVIENVEQYSRISREDLVTIMGEPASEEEWTNKTSKGDFLVTTLTYDKNTYHYEFIIADDAVVRLSIYSEQDWNNTGDLFTFSGEKEDITKLFNVTLGDNSKIITDNSFTFIISPVNDKIASFNVQDINDDTFGLVKITYNLNYFD